MSVREEAKVVESGQDLYGVAIGKYESPGGRGGHES